jgi:tetratricopeptide (TPR) repeat protein
MRHRSSGFIGAAAMAVLFAYAPPGWADEYSQGTADYAVGYFVGAKLHFIKAAAAKPKSWQAHYQLANTYIQLKDSANAKKSYLKCIACNPPADTKANCQKAIAYIASNPTLAAPAAAAPVYRPSMYSSGTRSSSTTSTAPSVGSSGSDGKEAQRAKIMQAAEAEIAKMRAEEEVRLKEMEANSNERYRQADGTVKTGLSTEEEAAFKKEVEQKASAIRENARRRADSIR